MTYTPYIRDPNLPDVFHKALAQSSYKAATEIVQAQLGDLAYGNYYIDTKSYVPSRSEQLLEDKVTRLDQHRLQSFED